MSSQTTSFDPAAIQEIENIWIRMRDGIRLAARLWLPSDAESVPVPAILEYIPYRKRDFTRERDEPMHRYFAHSGYASLRVDIRGSGDSEGVLTDEYDIVEQEDAFEIIEWIAAQVWCNGAVGMTGISWGGFNALQVASRRPPALKAIISLCSSDDRYADDAHFKGGCLLNENLQWGSILTLYNALPPDPEIVGASWRSMWQERLEAVDPFPPRWMRHRARDEYWRQGSVCEDYSAITCAVYAIGGWADGYTNAIPRLMSGLSCPRKALIGPWAHTYPHIGVPGPAIGYLQEAVRWWDHWLKGRDTGIMDEPMIRAWIQDPVRPAPQHDIRPGQWVGERSWPNDNVKDSFLYPARGRLATRRARAKCETVSSTQTVGVRGGDWCGFGVDGEAPRDQRPDDGGSLVFDSEPFGADTVLFGTPLLEIDVMSDRPNGILVARLCDVAPNGASLLVSYGILNLSCREGFDRPHPLVPGEWYPVALELDCVGHYIRPGHRLRLAVSTCYWPMIWPVSEPFVLSLRTGVGRLSLPVRPPGSGDADQPDFGVAQAAPGAAFVALKRRPSVRKVEVDLKTGEMVHTVEGGSFGDAELARLHEIDLDLSYWLKKEFRIREDDPLSARASISQHALLCRADWQVRVTCETELEATENAFQFRCQLTAKENDTLAFQRSWAESIPRTTL